MNIFSGLHEEKFQMVSYKYDTTCMSNFLRTFAVHPAHPDLECVILYAQRI